MNSLIPIHRHLGELLLLLPVVVILLALTRGKTVLARIVPVLLDVQLVLGLVTYVFVSGTKPLAVLHVVCMIGALGLAHAFAKKDGAKRVALGFAGVLALLVLGYLFQKNALPNGGLYIPKI